MKTMKTLVGVAALFWSAILLTAVCVATEDEPEYIYHTPQNALLATLSDDALDAVTDLIGAEDMVRNQLQALKENGVDLNDAAVSNQVTNLAEAAIAQVAVVEQDGGAVVVNRARIEETGEDETSLADRASYAAEQIRAVLLSEGFEESRPIRTMVTFRPQTESFQPVVAEVAGDTLSTVVDVVRIQAPKFSLLINVRKLEDDFRDSGTGSLRFTARAIEGSANVLGTVSQVEVTLPDSGIFSPVYLCLPAFREAAEFLTMRNLSSEDSEQAVTSFYDAVSGCLYTMVMESGVYSLSSHSPLFSDIDGLPQEMREAIETLSVQDIIRGYADGTFRPFNSVTRAHFVAFTLRAMGRDKDLHRDTNFSDVPRNSWCYHVVSNAEKLGLIKGIRPDFFGANYPINSTQIYIVTGRVLNYWDYPIPKNYLAILQKAFSTGFETYSKETQEWLALSTSRALVLEQTDKIFNGQVVLNRGNVAVVTNRLRGKGPNG